MKKMIGKTALALSVAAALVGAAQAEDKVVHVYNWSDYIAEDTVTNFEKASGIKVVYRVLNVLADHPQTANQGDEPF